MSVFSRTDTSLLSTWWWTIDRYMLVAVSMLLGVGVFLTFGASPAIAEKLGLPSFHFTYRQLVFIAMSMIIMFGISLASPITVRRIAVIMFVGCLGLMLLTLLIGTEVKGAQRWLPLGSFTLQPSEFLKPAFIVVSAWMFAEAHRSPGFPGRRIAMGLYVLVVLLLVAQPDFGQTILLSLVWGGQFFMAGLPMLWVGVLIALGLSGLLVAYTAFPHFASRIDRFLDPSSGDTYQVDTALNAFRTGGLFGRGPGEGAVKKVLPDAHTDFIFAVAGEEFGMFFCLFVIMIFAVIVVRGMMSLLRETDLFIFLATAGLLMQLGLQAVINIGVNLALLPSKGMTLPFISYGGSSMLALSIGMGMILALSRRYQGAVGDMSGQLSRGVRGHYGRV